MFPEGRAVELLVAAIVALIVVGPKDLPILLRKLGQFMAKVRSMAAEFRASFDEMARQSELDELRKEVEAMRKGQALDLATHAPEVNQTFDEISQGLSDVGVSFDTPAYPYVDPHAGPAEPAAKPVRARKASGRKTTGAKKASPKKAGAKPAAAAKKPAAPKTVAAKGPAAKPAAKPKAAPPKPAAAKASAKAAPAKPRARKVAAS